MATQSFSMAGISYEQAPGALVVAHGADAAAQMADLAGQAGYRVVRQATLDSLTDTLSVPDSVELIAVDTAGAPEAILERAVDAIDRIARREQAAVLTAAAEAQIDLVATHLLGGGRRLLCGASTTERAGALIEMRLNGRPHLNDSTHEAETSRLQRLNEEVARIADTLARLTRGEDVAARGASPVRAPAMDYRGPDEGDGKVSAAEVRSAIRARRMRAQFFAGELFADPAWDMLLDLFAAELENRQVSVSSLCIAAAVPPTTALRWIGTLHDAGLFERQADPSDRRRAYIGLSAKGLEGMRSYASAVKRAGLQLA
jgi:hypothetical protein